MSQCVTLGFQFTHPGRGATLSTGIFCTCFSSFNSRTPGGVRHKLARSTVYNYLFQFTHPGRGATGRYSKLSDDRVKFQFTHPGRGATIGAGVPLPRLPSFNSRTPGGVRLTLIRCSLYGTPCFNSRTPGGVRLVLFSTHCKGNTVSIHAPREGCDLSFFLRAAMRLRFQFTHPGRGATVELLHVVQDVKVSIHAPREGCDLADSGECTVAVTFQFTHPGRGATQAYARAKRFC